MSQSKIGSHIEAGTNLVIGYLIALIVWHYLAIMLSIPMPLETNILITSVMTVVSYCRSYTLRRVFNWINENRDEAEMRALRLRYIIRGKLRGRK